MSRILIIFVLLFSVYFKSCGCPIKDEILSFCIIQKNVEVIQGIIEQQTTHRATGLLWKAILLRLKKLKVIKIKFEEDPNAYNYGGFATDYILEPKGDQRIITIKYAFDKEGFIKIFRPIISYTPQALILSSIEIPAYICFSHELCHTLNILEYFDECTTEQRDAFLTREDKSLLEKQSENLLAIRKFLEQKHHFNWAICRELVEQEQLWGTKASIDDLLVILGTRRRISDTDAENVILGETDFVREHYGELSSIIEFFCWTHLHFSHEEWNYLSRFNTTSYELNFYTLLSYIRPIAVQLKQTEKILKNQSKHEDFLKELPCKNLNYKYINGSKFSCPKLQCCIAGRDFLVRFNADSKKKPLCFTPFVPPTETEVVIEDARVQLKNVVADGNCGVWALAQALRPDQSFIKPTFSQVKDMERLRARSATFVYNNNITGRRIAMSAFCANDLDHWLYTDDFRYFAQAIGRPIGIIVYGDGYRIYESSGNEIIYDNMLMFRKYLNQHPETLKICLIGNHYQAVTSITSNEK